MSAWSALASAFCRGRRVPRTGYKQLTSKLGPRTYYKGKGCAPTGRHTRKGEKQPSNFLKFWNAQTLIAVLCRGWASHCLRACPLTHLGIFAVTLFRWLRYRTMEIAWIYRAGFERFQGMLWLFLHQHTWRVGIAYGGASDPKPFHFGWVGLLSPSAMSHMFATWCCLAVEGFYCSGIDACKEIVEEEVCTFMEKCLFAVPPDALYRSTTGILFYHINIIFKIRHQ